MKKTETFVCKDCGQMARPLVVFVVLWRVEEMLDPQSAKN